MGIVFTEGSGLNNSIFGKSQAPIRMFLEARGESYEQTSIIKNLFQIGKSNHYGEKFTSLTAMNGFRPVGELGSHPVDEQQEGYDKTLEHMTWKDSFAISREIIEDGKVIDLKKKPAGFIKGYYRTRENFGAALLGGAIVGNTSVSFAGKSFSATTADNLSLFHAAHTAKVTATTQSNLFADVFSADALAAVEAAMQNFTGDNDEVLDVAPNTIVIPNLYALKKSVFAAVGADKDPDTANNGFNYQFGRWNIIVWPYLNKYISGSTAPWILLDSQYNEEYGGAVWLDRTALEVDSDVDKDTNANVWRGYARFIAGFNDWRFAAVGGVSTGSTLVS